MKMALLNLLAIHLGLAAVVAQPVITNQPVSQTNIAGATVIFSVGATGTPPLSYQWVFNTLNNRLPDATNDTLIIPNVQASNAGNYRVVITNDSGSVLSGSARLTVLAPPGIIVFPGDRTVVENESAELVVTATGTLPLSYQWRLNGADVASATRSNLVFNSVQPGNAGGYSVVITNVAGAITSKVARLTVVPATLLIRVTNGPVATDLGASTGCVWADFDNDGYLDFYVAQYRSTTNFFYHNNRDGTFARIPQAGSLVNGDYNLAVSAADYDNDGWLDFIVTAGGAAPTPRRSTLFHNNGDGTFSRANAGGITNNIGWFPSAQWADYDNDGFVDLLITQSDSTESTAYTNLLWHNNGDGTFASVTGNPLVTDRMAGWGLLWTDYDQDGFADVFVMSFADGHNYVYHNTGQGSFTRVVNSVVVTDAYTTVWNPCGDWGDYDNDGLLDLFVPDGGGGRNHLYHNDGGGRFSNVADSPMLTPPPGGNGRSVAWGDYDNDGYLDLLVGYLDRNLIYRNNHDGTFTEIKSIAPARDPLPDPTFVFNTRAWVDYDNDGFLDLHLTGGSFSNPRLPNLLYHNAGNSNNWLEVKCVGTVANRAGIGARIRVKANISGKILWQVRELRSGGGFVLATPLVAHFGLGDATNVETVRIEWPSGVVQELYDVSAKQTLTIIEPPRLTATIVGGQPQFSLKGGRNMTYDIQTSTNLADWSPGSSVMITNINGTVSMAIPIPEDGPQRYYRAVLR